MIRIKPLALGMTVVLAGVSAVFTACDSGDEPNGGNDSVFYVKVKSSTPVQNAIIEASEVTDIKLEFNVKVLPNPLLAVTLNGDTVDMKVSVSSATVPVELKPNTNYALEIPERYLNAIEFPTYNRAYTLSFSTLPEEEEE